MSKEWKPRIVVDESLFKMPELAALADGLGLTIEQAAGPLLKVWLWAQEHGDHGGSVKFPLSHLSVVATQFGFAKAMEAAGLAENGGPRSCRLLKWSEWVSKERAVGAQKAMRMAASRSGGDGDTGNKTTTKKGRGKKASSQPEPASDEPAVLVFPCNGNRPTWSLRQSQIDEWAKLFDGLDILAECKKALAWVQANGKKTATGMPKFLVGWFGRACDAGRGRRTQQQTTTGYGNPRNIADQVRAEIAATRAKKEQRELW